MQENSSICFSHYLAIFISVCLYLHIFPLMLNAEPIDISLQNTTDGKMFKLTDHRGRKIILVFGSIYCKPCIELLPVLNKIYENSKLLGVVVVGIDIDKTTDKKTINKFVYEKKIAFPFFIDTNGVARQNRVFILPTILLINSKGEEVKRIIGYKSYNVLEKEIKKLENR
jgi:thiol-disulfide isomerase/thioredoxin